MTLQSELQQNIEDAAFDADDDMTPSEAVTYNPYGGTPRGIQAIVERPDSDIHGNARTPVAILTVMNKAVTGIPTTEINVGKDTITVAMRYGKTATVRPVIRIVEHDAVKLVIEVH